MVALEIGYSGSCPQTRLEAVAFAGTAVDFEVVTITDAMACTDDYNPRTYVVALERESLPAPPFTIGRAGWPTAAAQVTEDLRQPGSTVAGLAPAPPPPLPVGLPGVIEPGFPWEARIDPRCLWPWLGELNGVHWRTAEEEVPWEWEDFYDEDGYLTVELLLTSGPDPSLTVTAGARAVDFEPARPPPGNCPAS